MAATYTLAVQGTAFALNKSLASIFNGAGSGVVLKIKRVWPLNNQTAAVTGVLALLELRRTSADSGGVTVAPTKHDTASANLPAAVRAGTGATVTNTADIPFRRVTWSNDEPAVSSLTNDEIECLPALTCIFDAATGDPDVEPIVLREGQGLTLTNTTNTSVGVIDVIIEFTT
jgi:hypothetical protein